MSAETKLVIPHRFRGPTRSANGGYACGAFAEALRRAGRLSGAISVTLNAPPPLDQELVIVDSSRGPTLRHGSENTIVAIATNVAWEMPPLPPVPAREAVVAAQSHFLAGGRHLFPECFTCGDARTEGDGLRIFPSAVGDVMASLWTPAVALADDAGRVANELLWAVLDCPSGFAAIGPTQVPMVLGTMCAMQQTEVESGREYLVCGWRQRSDGRKHHAGSAIFDGDHPVATATTTWIELSAEQAGRLLSVRTEEQIR